MECGIGLCGHCQMGPFFVCKDGPVFSLTELGDLLRPGGDLMAANAAARASASSSSPPAMAAS